VRLKAAVIQRYLREFLVLLLFVVAFWSVLNRAHEPLNSLSHMLGLQAEAVQELDALLQWRDSSSAAVQIASKPAALGAADNATASEML
jgi:hypothetical protein